MTIPKTYPYDFDPTYGMTLADLRAVVPPVAPDRFDGFWSDRYARAMTIDPQPKLSKSKSSHPRWSVFDITYTSTDAFTIGGWLLVPKRGEVRRGLVVGHGYGGRDAPNFDVPVENTAVLFPCFRGMSRSARPPISSEADWHVLHDIDKPERYIIGGCVEDLWLAVSALTVLYPRVAGRIGYSGISFGGGIGGLAIPFDRRIDRGHLSLPTFGSQELRLKLPSIGSAASVQRYQAKYGNALPTLRLHDSAVAANRITIPMLASVAQFDPAVAPPCQFAIANALCQPRAAGLPLPSKFNEIFILDAGHFDYPGKTSQDTVLTTKLRHFFKPDPSFEL
ncbi:acetylxylan esterase [Neorhizobium alkalisoli]|uniref:Cephalosporin-C deacetylase n=1 Tax=Neorhizobium alkalisoli TaxID=528178 RepID=A0A561QNL0_9HYPH|nr:acetylxylan esterase [Neorhizobium alkalisoli]TWF51981.1 cephalosporin-C deacetylase [Neorhizobium alkalisoli]